MRWRLMVARLVVEYLVSLRYAGHELRESIRGMAQEAEPWVSDRVIPGRPGAQRVRYERLMRDHWIGYEVLHHEHTIRVIYIQPAP